MARKASFTLMRLAALLVIVATAPACALVGYQDARLLAPKQIELTPSYSQVAVSGVAVGDDGKTETVRVVNNFGVHLALGLPKGVNVSAAVMRSQTLTGTGDGATGFALGIKFRLKQDRLALFVPAALVVGPGIDTSSTFVVRPTLIFTKAISPRIDFSPSGYVAVRFCSGCTPAIGADLGAGIKLGAHMIVRPAFGALVVPGDAGVYWSAGVGLSLRRK